LETSIQDFLDTAGEHAVDVLRIRDDEATSPKRVFHPGAAKLLQAHPDPKLLNLYFLA